MPSRMAAEVLAGSRHAHVERADCLPWLASLPDSSVDLVFGSPPYEDARLYLEDGQDLGLALDTDAWVHWMLRVVEASVRVCRGLVAFVVAGRTRGYRWSGAPVLLMAELIHQGYCLRVPPIYHRNGIFGGGGRRSQHADQGGGADWWRNDYEHIVCVTRGGKLPWADATAIGHPPLYGSGGDPSHRRPNGQRVNQWGGVEGQGRQRRRNGERQKSGRPSHVYTKNGAINGYANGDSAQNGVYVPPAIANPGNVLRCKVGGGQMGSRLCHANEAPFPERLAEAFARCYCRAGGLVLDPFSGSGTTAAIAFRWGRRALACDIRPSQVALSRRRLAEETWASESPSWWSEEVV